MTTATPSRPALLLLLAAVILSVPLLLGFFGAVHPALDSFAHFRMHFAVLMGACGLALLFTALRREGLMILLFAIGALATALMAFDRSPNGANASTANDFRYTLMQFNMRFDNPRPEEFVRVLAAIQPDVVTLQEVSRANEKWLERIRGSYPWQHVCVARGRIGGTAILSRRPFAQGSAQGCFENGYAAVAQVDLNGRAVAVASIHSLWPWPKGQPGQLEGFRSVMRGLGEPAILAGDFNAAPWSNAVRTVAEAGNAIIHSAGPTWLASEFPVSMRAWAGLPLDHVLTVGIEPDGPVHRAADGGSDHAPVVFRFGVAGGAESNEEPSKAVVDASRFGDSLASRSLRGFLVNIAALPLAGSNDGDRHVLVLDAIDEPVSGRT